MYVFYDLAPIRSNDYGQVWQFRCLTKFANAMIITIWNNDFIQFQVTYIIFAKSKLKIDLQTW